MTPSDVDAMGQDKRRQVVGHAYGPSRRSQFVFFGVIAAIAVLVVGGSALAVGAFDQPPDEYPDAAPWARGDAEQIPTRSPSTPCGESNNLATAANAASVAASGATISTGIAHVAAA